MKEKIRVIIADDHSMVREGLKQLIELKMILKLIKPVMERKP